MAMETLKKIWLDKGRFINKLHLITIIRIITNRLNGGCQSCHAERRTEIGRERPVPLWGNARGNRAIK
jgi:hypothetical protein